ncbi:phytanoyl-CoA dioxygenase family protein [Burkholderia plantarii]|uniref:phytanoyl-CoA dioxygenase family protein n=1 Tax=Burkholderia plantarii TaxID=41899 RepID=UPI000A942C97|nr:phytanoyl-CoA dioxygenase family protein [Burkholderia plantarii]WLE61505.1 phytanoyl-CoA dioxygenase family protein [Burkholderia plantarii]GLZ18924.1 hypothetical protein Bpla01_24540 [Burkholderia plantarii]
MKIVRKLLSPQHTAAALDWVMRRSEQPAAALEPEFDIADDERRLAKKIRKLYWADEPFWQAWLDDGGLGALSRQTLKRPKLIKHAAFIKRGRDESFIPLHQDIALWERKYETATTFWVALTESKRANGGMFFYPDNSIVYHHSLDLRYPMFKCINEEETRVDMSRVVDAELEAGDVLQWDAATAHGSHTNDNGRLRIGMPLVFVEEDEYAGFF